MKASAFGEIIFEISPYENNFFLNNSDKVSLSIFSNELFFLSNIANFNGKSYYISALPDNFLKDYISRRLNEFKIKDYGITFSKKGRHSILFSEKETEFDKKDVFERRGSVFDNLLFEDLKFNNIFSKSDHFHLSTITPALSYNVMDITLRALRLAKEMGLEVSLDVSYKENLWKYRTAFNKVDPVRVVSECASYSDVLTGRIDHFEKLFGYDASKGSKISKYENILLDISKNYPHLKVVALLIIKYDSFNQINFGAAMYVRHINQFYFAPNFYNKLRYFKIKSIKDFSGISSAFASGIAYGLRRFDMLQEVLDFALSNALLKSRYKGGFNYTRKEEVELLMNRFKTKHIHF